MSPDQEVVVLPPVLHLHFPHGNLLCPLRQGLRGYLLQKGERIDCETIVSRVILWLSWIAKFNFKLSYFQINPLLIMAFIANELFEN